MPKKKTSSEKTAKAKKKEKKKMMQAHGKEETFQKTTLDQVWGDTGNTRYGTLNQEEYSGSLSEMNKSDLQAHAHLHGLVPIDDRNRLTKKLLSEFKKYVSGFKSPSSPTNPSSLKSVSKEASRILSEGS
jgi:hypothetical protein